MQVQGDSLYYSLSLQLLGITCMSINRTPIKLVHPYNRVLHGLQNYQGSSLWTAMEWSPGHIIKHTKKSRSRTLSGMCNILYISVGLEYLRSYWLVEAQNRLAEETDNWVPLERATEWMDARGERVTSSYTHLNFELCEYNTFWKKWIKI